MDPARRSAPRCSWRRVGRRPEPRSRAASKGPAFRLAATCLRVNGPARRLLGVITGSGFTVEGSVIENADGTGSAKIDFHVNGSWRDGHIHMRAIERRRVWHLAGPGGLHVAELRRTASIRARCARWTRAAILPPVRTAELDYDLPPGLIAQAPAEPRSSARLLVYDRATRRDPAQGVPRPARRARAATTSSW